MYSATMMVALPHAAVGVADAPLDEYYGPLIEGDTTVPEEEAQNSVIVLQDVLSSLYDDVPEMDFTSYCDACGDDCDDDWECKTELMKIIIDHNFEIVGDRAGWAIQQQGDTKRDPAWLKCSKVDFANAAFGDFEDSVQSLAWLMNELGIFAGCAVDDVDIIRGDVASENATCDAIFGMIKYSPQLRRQPLPIQSVRQTACLEP